MRFKAFLKDSTNLHKNIKLTDFILHKKQEKMESMKSEQNRNNEMANTTTIILNLTL